MQGIVRFVSSKGWYFAECVSNQSSVFVHQKDVANNRYLRVDDRIEFDLSENPKHPGKMCAINVNYLGHSIASGEVRS